jgi:hypothetical protein
MERKAIIEPTVQQKLMSFQNVRQLNQNFQTQSPITKQHSMINMSRSLNPEDHKNISHQVLQSTAQESETLMTEQLMNKF